MDNQDQERNNALHDAEAAEKKAAEAKAETKQETAAASQPQMSAQEWCEEHPRTVTALVLGIPCAVSMVVGFALGRLSK